MPAEIKSAPPVYPKISDILAVFTEKLKQSQEKPNCLGEFIYDQDLARIYEYILHENTQKHIRELLEKHQKEGTLLRTYAKKSPQNLARSITLLQDLNHELILLLETQRTLADGRKIPAPPENNLLLGGFKDGKICWRIDCYPPEKWINQLPRVCSELAIAQFQKEACASQMFAHSMAVARELKHLRKENLFNYSLLGPIFQRSNSGLLQAQCSLYSPMAEYSLFEALTSTSYDLAKKAENIIAFNLLDAINVLHSWGFIHQDIKPENILIYQQGEYFWAKLTDFGELHYTQQEKNPEAPEAPEALATASAMYESPEISLAYSDPAGIKYDYFHSKPSYGRSVAQGVKALPQTCLSFRKPHRANDIWGIGILLFILYIRQYPNIEKPIKKEYLSLVLEKNPLLAQMLAYPRRDRITINNIIKQVQALGPANPIVLVPPKPKPPQENYLPGYLGKKANRKKGPRLPKQASSLPCDPDSAGSLSNKMKAPR